MMQNFSRDIDELYDLIAGGFNYLFNCAVKTGHWHDVRSTALAAMCLEAREDASSLWSRAVREWLEKQQLTSGCALGSWGEEIWDTAMCVLALKELGVSSRHPTIEKALHWIASLYSASGRGNWHDELWETCWALLAVLRAGRTLPHLDAWEPMRWLMSLQGPDGRIVAPHYTAYFVLIVHLSRKLELPQSSRLQLDQAQQRCIDYLTATLSGADSSLLWTGEAWSNGQIVWALCQATSVLADDRNWVSRIVRWFADAQLAAGNWSDVEDTASALLGLLGLVRILTVRSGVDEREVELEIERQLRKRVVVPPLKVRKPLIEWDHDTKYISIALPANLVKIVGALLGFLLVGVIGWLANVVQLMDVLFRR